MQALTFFFAFVAVLALIGAAAWLVRRFAGNRLGTNTNRGRMPRLAVIDAAAVDGRRRLVLVRRDNVEHLLMIGGPTDIVVEANIVRASPARDQLPQRQNVGTELPRIAPLADSPNWAESDGAPDHPEPQPEQPARPVRPGFRRRGPPSGAGDVGATRRSDGAAPGAHRATRRPPGATRRASRSCRASGSYRAIEPRGAHGGSCRTDVRLHPRTLAASGAARRWTAPNPARRATVDASRSAAASRDSGPGICHAGPGTCGACASAAAHPGSGPEYRLG